jgi:RNA polymerase sigma-70 factor (ECF subfamily)
VAAGASSLVIRDFATRAWPDWSEPSSHASAVRTTKDSEPANFRELYDAHARFVWRVLLRLGVTETELPDAVQDVFVVVHRKLPAFEARSKVTTWLFTICARVASDRRRLARMKYEALGAESAAGDTCADGEDELTALLDRRRARSVLDAIMARMPGDQRLVFALFELDGMSGEEIAEMLDVPVGTVRSRLRLARAVFETSVARLKNGAAPRAPTAASGGST